VKAAISGCFFRDVPPGGTPAVDVHASRHPSAAAALGTQVVFDTKDEQDARNRRAALAQLQKH
jgi:hypothetical protein